MKNKYISTFLSVSVFALVLGLFTVPTRAECTPNYGGGENCVYESRFKIKKYVKLEDDNSWKDEVLIDLDDDDEDDKKILFKVEVTVDVEGDDIDEDSIEFDDMEMKDSLPDELKFLSESEDDLTEEWDNFKAGDKKTFYFTTKITDSEKKKDGSYEKCVINTAKLYQDGDKVDDDDAVVCYKRGGDVLGTSTELPETGTPGIAGISGILSLALGAYLRLKKN